MSAASAGITVAVRLRPFNQREARLSCANVVSMPSPGIVTVAAVRNGKISETEKPREFSFDEVLWTHDANPIGPDGKPSGLPFADQGYVYNRVGEPCVSAVLSGFHACLFAYGQTGSGKTYTMMGYPQDPGLIPRMCGAVFALTDATATATISSNASGGSGNKMLLSVDCSYMEIYNERVLDLLDENGKGGVESAGSGSGGQGLRVRQHPVTGVFVEGLKKFSVSNEMDVLALISDGDRRRTVAATNMNAVSSRSHAILVLSVSQTCVDDQGRTTGKAARMSLVDLAGSERVSSTGAEGDTLQQGACINRSLTVLGMCLSRLADASESPSGKSSLPIPFRDSSLTFILNESLGGNSKTTMIAAISPADVNADETVSALRFAQVTKRVKTKPVVNENPNAKVIRELREELDGLRERLASLTAARLLQSSVPPTGAAARSVEGNDEGRADGPISLGGDNDDETRLLMTQIEVSKAFIDTDEMQSSFPSESFAADGGALARTTTTTTRGRGHSGISGDEIFVDWSQPNFINASPSAPVPLLPVVPGKALLVVDQPSSAESVMAMMLCEGSACRTNSISIEVEYIAISKEVFLSVLATKGGGVASDVAVTINGVPVARGRRSLLAHNDRIVIGCVALRFTNPAGVESAREFSCAMTSIEHLEHLETLHRKMLQVEEHRVYLEDFGICDADGDGEDDDGPRHTADKDETLIRLTHEQRTLETSAAALFPVTGEELRLLAAAAAPSRPQQHATPSSHGIREADVLLATIKVVGAAAGAAELMMVSHGDLSAIVGPYDDMISERQAAVEEQELLIRELRKTLLDQVRREQQQQHHVQQEHDEGQQPSAGAAGGQLLAANTAPSSSSARQLRSSASLASDGTEETSIDDFVSDALEDELQWHTAVIQGRQFKPHGPLDDPAATALWTRVACGSDKRRRPFFKEIKQRQIAAFLEAEEMAAASGGGVAGGGVQAAAAAAASSGTDDPAASLQRQSSSSVLLMSPWQPLHSLYTSSSSTAQTRSTLLGDDSTVSVVFSSRGAVLRSGPFHKLCQKGERWEQRYGLICDRFLYYFHACNGTERAIAAIYLFGATFSIPTRPVAKRDNCILLTTTTPRRTTDSSSSYFLSFRTSHDRLLWCHWIAEASVPPVPRLMRRRLMAELKEGIATGALTVALIQSRPQHARFFYIPVSEWGFPELEGVVEASDDKRSHMNWDADETATACSACKAAFTFFRRRHHCRSCGRIFCNSCTQFIPMRNEKGETKPKRSCNACAQASRLPAVAGAAPAPTGQKPDAGHHEA